MPLRPVEPADAPALEAFLAEVDLTTSGLDAPTVRLWIDEDAAGRIVASTGYEATNDGAHALVRSVAVLSGDRGAGRGTALATFAIERAREAGATTAWLFSRRSGPFWQGLGFEPTTTDALAAVLGDTQQVRLFAQTGQLAREVAWRRMLAPVGAAR